MDTTTPIATPVYSTSTEGEAVFAALSAELVYELGLESKDSASEGFYTHSDASYYEYCFVCSRATDHRSEHDDLLEQGLVRYGEGFDGSVYLLSVPAEVRL